MKGANAGKLQGLSQERGLVDKGEKRWVMLNQDPVTLSYQPHDLESQFF